jgi:hypothetical protein
MSGRNKKITKVVEKKVKGELVKCLVDEVSGEILQVLNEAGIWIQVAGSVGEALF